MHVVHFGSSHINSSVWWDCNLFHTTKTDSHVLAATIHPFRLFYHTLCVPLIDEWKLSDQCKASIGFNCRFPLSAGGFSLV